MVFEPKVWRDYPIATTPISADELNRIEQGISDAIHPIALTPDSDIMHLKSGVYRVTIDAIASQITGLPLPHPGILTVRQVNNTGSNYLQTYDYYIRRGNLEAMEEVGQYIRLVDPTREIEGPWEKISLTSPPRESFFTDFSNDALGEIPEGFSLGIFAQDEWSVQPSQGATGGKALVASINENRRSTLIWDEVGENSDFELVVCYRGPEYQNAFRPLLDYTESADGITGHSHYYSSDADLVFLIYTDGDFGALPRIQAEPHRVGIWRIFRLRVEGASIATKDWVANKPEPLDWDAKLNRRVSGLGSKVALMIYKPETVEINWVGGSADGGRAPKAGQL